MAERRNQERAHQETLMHMEREVEELRKFRCSEAEVCEEACVDAVSEDGESNLETESRESQCTVNQLTHQMLELHEVINSLSDSQYFKDFETASNSGRAHAPGNPFVFSEFFMSAVP